MGCPIPPPVGITTVRLIELAQVSLLYIFCIRDLISWVLAIVFTAFPEASSSSIEPESKLPLANIKSTCPSWRLIIDCNSDSLSPRFVAFSLYQRPPKLAPSVPWKVTVPLVIPTFSSVSALFSTALS